MNYSGVIDHLTQWLSQYSEKSKTSGFVVGVSGGIDSAVTSTLCARTGKPTLVLEMPIHQAESQVNRAQEHIAWLKKNHPNVHGLRIELTSAFETLKSTLSQSEITNEADIAMSLANTRARLRMTTLYYYAGVYHRIVAGTGNRVEDFGVGFYTKYGDGGVDVSPIADLMKTEVYALAKELGVVQSIQNAAPTDGLFGDNRTDEDQIGASYPELEWAMRETDRDAVLFQALDNPELMVVRGYSERQQKVMTIFLKRNRANRHKMDPIPVCVIPDHLR